MKFLLAASLFAASLSAALPVFAQGTTPWTGLDFLKGSWTATAEGEAGVRASGVYAFRSELGGHVMARYSSRDAACKGPVAFDCEHGDSLYIFEEAPGQPLKAIYFDNEGHVIHYDVSTPEPNKAVFVSDPAQPGPRFRLQYELKGSEMSGKFQVQLPGQSDWKSYLDWRGTRQ